jgi:hypothetical protein
MPEIPRAPGVGDVTAYRPWFRTHVRPRVYFPMAHLVVHLGPLIATCIYAATQLKDVSALAWLTVPAWLLVGSAFVYWFHRHVLHRPTRLFYFAYKRHTLQHHRFFDYEHITPDEPKDLYNVLFPWWTGTFLCGLSYVICRAITPQLGPNVAYLTMFTMCMYLALYEFIHSVSHLSERNFLVRMPVLSFLREHHRIHHDPALMGKYNFNVVIPLFDWLFGALLLKRPTTTSSVPNSPRHV